MAITLTDGITAIGHTLPVANPEEARRKQLFRIDDEVVSVINVGDTSLRVYRGVLGTEAASHLSGASVDPFDITSTGSATAVTLAGPYRVNWNTVGAVDPAGFGLELGDTLPIGAVVQPFAIMVTPFDDNATADVGVGLNADSFSAAVNYDFTSASVNLAELEAHNPDSSASLLRLNMAHRAVIVGACKLMVAIYSGSSNVTQGAVDIYAVIVGG